MKIGFGAPIAGAWATPGYLSAFAERAEDAGYASLWTFQRLLVPEGSGMEPVYHSVLDPMVALGYVAARTSRIRLGVAIINLPFVSPAYLAKQATTVDVLSGGRFDLGLGIGWMPEEFAATGASMPRRGARAEEYLAVLRTLWADEVSSHDGDFYTVPAGRQDPKPVQKPGPPVLLGGMSAPAMERAGRMAAGWVTSSPARAGRGAGRTDGGRLDHLQPRRPDQDQRGGRRDQGGSVGGGPRSRGRAHHLPGRRGGRHRGEGTSRRPPAAVRQLPADPPGRRVARRARGH